MNILLQKQFIFPPFSCETTGSSSSFIGDIRLLAIASLSCMLVYQVLPQNRRFGLSSGHAPHSGFLPDRFHLLPAASSILPETDILLSGAQCHKLLSWRCLLIEADHSQPQIMGRHKKGLRLKSQPLEIPGATCQTRTDDLLITNQLLYQLSQGGAA